MRAVGRGSSTLLGERLTRADAILHAGDITDVAVLGALAAFAPTYAVLGNNDHGVALPERRVVDLDGCQVAMVHDSGQAGGRAARLRRWFPDADAVVFGHSHLPWDEVDVDPVGHVQHHVNPGSATQRRRAPRCTVAWLTIEDGALARRAPRGRLTDDSMRRASHRAGRMPSAADRRAGAGGERMGRLDGKVAIVTGGSRGQGAAEVRLFAAEGAKVVVGDVLTDAGQQLADELGDSVVFTHLDVSSEEEWAAATALAVERFGALNVLVNNAGIAFTSPIADHSVADFERIIAVNQIGVFLGIRSAIAPMRAAGGGSIVNTSSGAGLRATKYMIAYSASKYAVTGMTASAALELARDGIRVNSIHPGVIDTPMLGDAPSNIDTMIKHTPLRRMGTPEEIAAVALFLASDESSYMTGAHVPVDGGVIA